MASRTDGMNGASNSTSISHSSNGSLPTHREDDEEEEEEKPSSSSSSSTMITRKEKTVSAEDVFPTDDAHIKEDIVRMILQYLRNEGYAAASLTLQDEANVKFAAAKEKSADLKALKKAIREGAWGDVEKMSVKLGLKNNKRFLYSIYKQQYLEHIESGEFQKAFTYLTKRLKPLENFQNTTTEFKDLCYLLSCKSVQDAPSFRNWEGVGAGREHLVEELQETFDADAAMVPPAEADSVPPDRLLNMLRQAVAYQIEFSRYHPKLTPKVSSLLEDYSCNEIPNALYKCMTGHTANVKCAEFAGDEGLFIVSGASDNMVNLWNTKTGELVHTFPGHKSRVWSVCSDKSGSLVASSSGDGSVKLWDTRPLKMCQVASFDSESDVYSVQFHPHETHIVSGGYNKLISLHDIRTGQTVKTFSGHQSAVTKVIFNQLGNVIISGSKDHTIKFWDIRTGVSVNSLSSHLGEVTSVALNSAGNLLLSCAKDNSNRVWDTQMLSNKIKLKGHQNAAKNFIRAEFGRKSTVVGGSEDGLVYIWDMETGNILQRLEGHRGVAYSAVWNSKQSLLLSCGDDRTVRTWCFDENKPQPPELLES